MRVAVLQGPSAPTPSADARIIIARILNGPHVSRGAAAHRRRRRRAARPDGPAHLRMRRTAPPARVAGRGRAAFVRQRGAGGRRGSRKGCRSSRAGTARGCPAARCRRRRRLIVLSRLNRMLDVEFRTSASPSNRASSISTSRGGRPVRLPLRAGSIEPAICSIGGNIAENSGGAHCLKYGFTVHHVLGVEAVLPNGDLVHLGGAAVDAPGLDLSGVLVGSEGTLGGGDEGDAAILRRPEAVRTLLAAFDVDRRRGQRRVRQSSAPASFPRPSR